MTRRNREGQYSKRHFEKYLFASVVVVILFGFVFEILNTESVVIHVAEAEEIAPVAEVVLIEVVYDLAGKIAAIREMFPEMPNTAVAVAISESGTLLNTGAYNPEAHRNSRGEVICNGSFGVMQIGCVHHANYSELEDFKFNLKVARRIYDDSLKRTGNGWLPWGGYTNGSYKKFL